jgi:hypothetical protein
MLQTDPQLTFCDDKKSSIFDIMRNDTPISVFTKCVLEVNAQSDNPIFTNGMAIQVAIKDGKDNDAYTENLSKATESVNEHGNHPLLSQCVFILVGRGYTIDHSSFCSFIRTQNEFMHNIHLVEIHGRSDIDIERHFGNNMDDGEYISNSIREILLDASDDNGLRLFHSIERTTKSDTIRAIFTKQNQDACLITKLIDDNSCFPPTTIRQSVHSNDRTA